MNIESVKKIELICQSGYDKKADEIVIMDMTGKSTLCDHFVVMSAPSTVRVKAIVDSIEESLEDKGLRPMHKEGYQEAMWVLLDYGDVVAHVFYQDTRKFYGLEYLWGDAPKREFTGKK